MSWVTGRRCAEVVFACAALAACSGVQSVFDPYGPQAREIASMGTMLIAGAAIIFIAVVVLALAAIFAPRPIPWLADRRFVVGAGVVFPLIVLSALLIYTLIATAVMLRHDNAEHLRIEVTGEQWWWRVRYMNADGALEFETANELHLPLGRSIELQLKTADVIHSFWLPRLAGKLDMVPGRVNTMRIKADQVGVMRGQCAEFCGGPHAQMAFYALAKTPDDFESWRSSEAAIAIAPAAANAVLGQKLFLERGCGICHTVRGTEATGTRGPDLTHVGRRMSLAAGILPNNTGSIAGWIAHSQKIKPGNLMPSFAQSFTGDELTAVAEYLEGLK